MPDVLSQEEAEEVAVRAFGRWRDGLKTRVLAIFVLSGVVAGMFGYWVVREIQFSLWHANWPWLSGIVGFGGPMAGASWLGAFIARRIVTVRTPAQVAVLAARHEVPAEKLAEIARMADRI